MTSMMKYDLDGKRGSGLVRVLLVISLLTTVATVCSIVAVVIIGSRDPQPDKDTDSQVNNALGQIKERLEELVPPVTQDPSQEPCLTDDCIITASDLIQRIDPSSDPCEDFVNFVCANYQKRPIQDDRSSNSAFLDLRDKTALQLRDILEEPSSDDEMEALSHVKALYTSCMTTDVLDGYGVTPLLQLFNTLSLKWQPVYDVNFDNERFDLEDLLVKLTLHDLTSFLDIFVWNDIRNSTGRLLGLAGVSLQMGGRDYYFNNGTELPLFKDYIVSLMKALNYTQSQAEDFRDRVIDFEIALANVTIPRDDDTPYSERYKVFTIKELSTNISENFNWLKYINKTMTSAGIVSNIDENEEVVLYYPSYFMDLIPLLTNTSPRTLMDYVTLRVIRFGALWLSEEFRKIVSDYSRRRSGRPSASPRWRTCVAESTDFMEDAISNAYVKAHFHATSKQDVLAIISDLRISFDSIIRDATWMDNVTQTYAREKLAVIQNRIGYPERILDVRRVNARYSEYVMDRTRLFDNLVNGRKIDEIKYLNVFTEPRGPGDGFTTSAFTVNAFFSPSSNNIIFPAAFLQTPFFDPRHTRSMNYGAIGSIIGHELTHGFDNSGRQYDKEGAVTDWWSDGSKRNFIQRAQCLVNQYSRYTVQGENVNGRLTLGENIADNGGLKEAFKAYQLSVQRLGSERPLPGVPYTHEQLFFISFASGWCMNSRPQYEKYILNSDNHSPSKYRIIGTLQNSEDFANVFQCRRGTFMNPARKCSVW